MVLSLRLAGQQLQVRSGGELLLGRDPRSPTSTLLRDHDNISRNHATIGSGPGTRAWVRDEVSTNGTFVDDVPVPSGTTARVSSSVPLHLRCELDDAVVVAVADGLGGHAAGEVAAEHAVRRLAELGPSLTSAERISDALRGISDEIALLAKAEPSRSGMGATVAGVAFTPTHARASPRRRRRPSRRHSAGRRPPRPSRTLRANRPTVPRST
jgi:hypothetical protein